MFLAGPPRVTLVWVHEHQCIAMNRDNWPLAYLASHRWTNGVWEITGWGSSEFRENSEPFKRNLWNIPRIHHTERTERSPHAMQCNRWTWKTLTKIVNSWLLIRLCPQISPDSLVHCIDFFDVLSPMKSVIYCHILEPKPGDEINSELAERIFILELPKIAAQNMWAPTYSWAQRKKGCRKPLHTTC